MAQNTILLKRSALQGKTPDTGSLQLGEVAINTFDGKVFIKRSGSIESIQEILTTNAEITGSLNILGGVTGSLFGTSSWAKEAISASYSLQATTASFALNFNPDATASYAISSSQAINADSALTSSYVEVAQTASYVLNAVSASQAQNANTAVSASYALNATNALTASYFVTSSVTSASFAENANLLDGKDSTEFATTGSNIFKGSQTINGNLFLSSSNPLLYNDGNTNAMLFGFFDGGNIYGPYYQIFGNQYTDLTQRGSAEFVYDNRNGGGSGFNIASFNGSSWTRKFRVDDNGAQVSGSLQVTNGITGSLEGTASFATNALNASTADTATSASHALNSDTAISSSYALNSTNAIQAQNADTATSASQAQNSNNALNAVTASQALEADYAVTASQAIYSNDALSSSYAENANTARFATTSSYADNFTVAGTLTAQKIIVQTITSSMDYVTGSTIFGSSLTNTHQFTGSVTITGSLAVNNSNVILTNQTSSMTVLSASQAQNANTATSASYALNATNAISASQAQNANIAVSASYALNSTNTISSSYAVSASQATNSNTAISASHALNANNAISASYALSSSHATNLTGSVNYIPVLNSSNSTTNSAIYQSGSYSIAINQTNVTTDAPEALYVWQPNINSFNVISGKGNSDNYLQLNIQNTNLGTSASSDIVATANNGTETSFYVDMGINNENYIDNGNGVGSANDSYVYSLANHFHIGNAAANQHLGFFVGGFNVYENNKLELRSDNLHQLTGSLVVHNGVITSSLLGTASYATNASNATSASYAQTATNAHTASYALEAVSSSYSFNSTSASYAYNADLIDGIDSTRLATTGSNTFIGNEVITGSLNITGSTTLRGSTLITGSLIFSGAFTPGSTSASMKIHGNTVHDGYIEFIPVSVAPNTSISASYIFASGSTQDLYFAQNGNGYNNVTRLRWLEGNLYTGLLNGGLLGTASSTVYTISSGSGIIVNLNASLTDNPYPTIQYINWGNLSQSIAPLSASYDQQFVGIQSNGAVYAQGVPFTDGQFDTLISLGVVLHQNRSTINGVATQPHVAYGWEQRSNIFISAFGPLKLSGYNIAASGSSTGSLVVGNGTAYLDGGNYSVDPNNPSYIVGTGATTTRIFKYYQSGSGFVYDTNNGAGYGAVSPKLYNNNGTLTTVPGGNWTIQRAFFFPSSPLSPKPIVVYYGNAIYASEAEARANIDFEPFAEAPNTAANAIYLGALVLKDNADFTNSGTFTIYPGGLFRQVGGSGGGGSTVTTTLSGLSDVNISGPTNGQPLVYNTTAAKWENLSYISGSVYGNAQTATSASYASIATSASYVQSATSASYALTASFALNVPVTASYAISASQATNANSAISASFSTNSTSASYALNATNAATASYVLNAVSSSFAISASQASNANTATSASFASQASSSRYAATSSYSENLNIKNTYTFDETLNDYSLVTNSIVGVNNVFTQPTGSFTSAFFKYTVQKGLIARTGEVMAVFNDNAVDYTDFSTNDIGSGTTNDVIMYVTLAGPNLEFNAETLSSGWSVKALATYM